MGILIYLEGYKAEMLPAYAHWCGHPPAYDDEKKLFVEPYLPHLPLGVIHLTGMDAMRGDRNFKEEFSTPKGKTLQMNIRYPHFDGGLVGNGAPDR